MIVDEKKEGYISRVMYIVILSLGSERETYLLH